MWCYYRWTCLNNIKKHPRFTARCPEGGRLTVHPSSVMAQPKQGKRGSVQLCDSPGANWLVYWLKQRSSDLFIFDVTLIYTLPLLFFGEFIVTNGKQPHFDVITSYKSVNDGCTHDKLWLVVRFLLNRASDRGMIDLSDLWCIYPSSTPSFLMTFITWNYRP